VRVGRVYLVGAGPGDPGLMTLRGLMVLRAADVVVYDRLVNPAILDEAPSHALKIYAGKRADHHPLDQEHINTLLVHHARRGCAVVRLKGGDPFVFGRGGEEAESLTEAGIPFDIVPGVTAAIAVPALAGIPLTHRGWSSSFAVVTGHDCAKDRPGVDWARLASAVDTLVVLMAARTLPRIARELMIHGRSARTPVALIHGGTTEAETTIICTLGEVAGGIELDAPVVAVIGDVVAVRQRLGWSNRAGQEKAVVSGRRTSAVTPGQELTGAPERSETAAGRCAPATRRRPRLSRP
jgi:uroporphyrin-III C-methyltransferase